MNILGYNQLLQDNPTFQKAGVISQPLIGIDVANKTYVDTSITAEDLWDRTGTTLSTHTSGDLVSISNIQLPTGANIDIKDANNSTLNIINSTTGKKVGIVTDGPMIINSRGLASNYELSVQSATNNVWMEMINATSLGVGYGAFFGMDGTSGNIFEQWSYNNTATGTDVSWNFYNGGPSNILGTLVHQILVNGTHKIPTSMNINTINEYTLNTGTTINSVLLKAGDVTVDNNSLITQSTMYSMCGFKTFPSVTTGTGTVDVGTCDVVLKYGANTRIYTIPAVTNAALTDNRVNHILVSYNFGTPAYVITTDFTSVNYTDIVPIGNVFRDGATNYVNRYGQNCIDYSALSREYLTLKFGLNRATGMIITTPGTNKLYVTAGSLYYGATKIAVDILDTPSGNTFYSSYYNGSAWVNSAGITDWDPANYNNIASGLVALSTANKYGFFEVWFVLNGNNIKGGLYRLIYGQAEYDTIPGASAASILTVLPDKMTYNPTGSIYCGRIVFKKSATSGTIFSAFVNSSLQIAPVTSHGNLSDLTVDDHTQYSKVSGRTNEIMTWNGTGGFRDSTFDATYGTYAQIGMKNTGTTSGLHFQNAGNAYDSYSFGNLAAGTMIYMYDTTKKDDGSIVHSSNGNGYYMYHNLGAANACLTWDGSYNKTAGTTFSGITLMQLAMTGNTTGSVKFPPAYAYNASAGVALYITSAGFIGGNSSLSAHKDLIQTKDYTDMIKRLNIVTYIRKKCIDGIYTTESDPQGIPEAGLLAEEMEQIDNSFCSYIDENNPTMSDKVHLAKKIKLRGINYDKLICPMIQFMQNQQKTIDTLTSQLGTLTIRLNQLETQLIQHLGSN
jgi:hypothetical protein